MVHGLAQQLCGALTIHSRVGEGTTVDFWLPLGGPASVNTALPSGIAARLDRRGTVLLIDDEELIRLSTADMLVDLGFEVVEAASAEEALGMLKDGLDPQLVVTDHLMPGMAGTELARKLQLERTGLKILVISGYAETGGFAPDLPRLNKPFLKADLARSLAALV